MIMNFLEVPPIKEPRFSSFPELDRGNFPWWVNHYAGWARSDAMFMVMFGWAGVFCAVLTAVAFTESPYWAIPFFVMAAVCWLLANACRQHRASHLKAADKYRNALQALESEA